MGEAILGLAGAALVILALVFFLIWLRRVENRAAEFIPFQKSVDPPDEGLVQRIYNPPGSPAQIDRNAIRRRVDRREE